MFHSRTSLIVSLLTASTDADEEMLMTSRLDHTAKPDRHAICCSAVDEQC